jgi:hypothetical protein
MDQVAKTSQRQSRNDAREYQLANHRLDHQMNIEIDDDLVDRIVINFIKSHIVYQQSPDNDPNATDDYKTELLAGLYRVLAYCTITSEYQEFVEQQKSKNTHQEIDANALAKELVALLDIVEVTNNGNQHRPNQVTSSRATDSVRIAEILMQMKNIQ